MFAGLELRLTGLALIAALIAACGSTPTPAAARPSPPLSSYDQELLGQLSSIDFRLYETPLRIGAYIFTGAGLNYDLNTLQLGYNGLFIEEWKALNWNPSSGKCSTADPKFSWNCSFLVKSSQGHLLFAGQGGGLSGQYLGDVYVELGTTVVHIAGATNHVPTEEDLVLLADGFKPVTPADVIVLNQQAGDYAEYLRKTAASRIDFKTYLPTTTVVRFGLDKKLFQNVVDPMHPYLYLHFGRIAQGNQAFEFSAYEFKDSVPLSDGHCGPEEPELTGLTYRCTFAFTTGRGIAVYSTRFSTKFDLPATRVVLELSMTIDEVARDELSRFIDSFTEVPAQSIG